MKLRPFELVLVVVFCVLGFLALFLLSTYQPSPENETDGVAIVGDVSIWGTLPQAAVNSVLQELSAQNEQYLKVSYRYVSENEFDTVLLNALADGVGPDLIIHSQERLVEMRRRLQPVSYESFPVRDIRNLYIDGSQIFMMSDGLYAYPIAADPLMMYWNRDLLASDGFLEPPRTWESLVNTYLPVLIRRDFDRTINRSVVALGEYGNIRNGFGIISALLIQGGSQTVIEDGSRYLVRMQNSIAGQGDPLYAAADFYTRFSKPSNTLYSWNRSFGEDRGQFVGEDLAFYFGYGSEGPEIERVNPNLNFDIAEIPQGAVSTIRRTYGKFYGLSALRSSDNPAGAAAVMFNLGTEVNSQKIALTSNMVPVYRSLVDQGSNNTYGRITYGSVSIARGWLNPDIVIADGIFETMTQDINENRRDVGGAVSDVTRRLLEEY